MSAQDLEQLPALPVGVAVVTAKPGCAGTSAHVRIPQEPGAQLYSAQQVRDLMRDALRQQPAPTTRDRELDRKHFTDASFNEWLDTGISDAGHTVWDAIGDTQAAWAGWDARPFAGDAVMLSECCGREECGGGCGNAWLGVRMYRKPTEQPAPVVDDALADTQRAIIEAAERRGYERAKAEAVVVGDAMVARALNAKAGNWPVWQLFSCEDEAREIMRIALTAALARAQGVQS